VIYQYSYVDAARDKVISPFALHNIRVEMLSDEQAAFDKFTEGNFELAATLGVALIAVTVGVRLVNGSVGFETALTVLCQSYDRALGPDLMRQLDAFESAARRAGRGASP
jgi:superfamily II DNA or RNA helicase